MKCPTCGHAMKETNKKEKIKFAKKKIKEYQEGLKHYKYLLKKEITHHEAQIRFWEKELDELEKPVK